MEFDSSIYAVAIGGLALYQVGLVVTGLYFHPLSNIPGPKLAAISRLYITYFNATGGSKFYLQIEELHERYGTLQAVLNILSILAHGI